MDSMIVAAVLAAAHLAAHVAAPPCPAGGVPGRGGVVAAEKGAAADGAPVHINQATADELRKLPGVGPKKAERILQARERGPFRRPSDLRRVKGFGARTIQRLAPRLVFD